MGILSSILTAPCCISLFKKRGMGPDERSIKHHGSIKGWELRNRCTLSHCTHLASIKVFILTSARKPHAYQRRKHSILTSAHYINLHRTDLFLTHPDQLSLRKYTHLIYKRDTIFSQGVSLAIFRRIKRNFIMSQCRERQKEF